MDTPNTHMYRWSHPSMVYVHLSKAARLDYCYSPKPTIMLWLFKCFPHLGKMATSHVNNFASQWLRYVCLHWGGWEMDRNHWVSMGIEDKYNWLSNVITKNGVKFKLKNVNKLCYYKNYAIFIFRIKLWLTSWYLNTSS